MMISRCLLIAALLAGLAAPIRAQEGFDLRSLQLPRGFLDLSDVVLGTRSDGTISMAGIATLQNARTHVLISSRRGDDGQPRTITLGLKPEDWSLTDAIPQLAIPPLEGITFQHVGLVLSGEDVAVESYELEEPEYSFYAEIYGTADYTLRLTPGINLIASIPVDELEDGHPLLLVMDVLGIERGTVLLQGTLGRSLLPLGGGGSGSFLRDVFLRAELPPLRPPNSPEWFVSGQLALEITGLPSVAVAGEMTVNIEEAQLAFRLAATLARTGISLSGGLAAAEPWVSPFGIDWLTFNQVLLMIGITPTGSLNLGFRGDMVIGEKDIDVAVLVALNLATGAPTNFMFDGESEDGVALADLVMLQQRMAAARRAAEAAAGAAVDTTTRIPLDALPDIGIENIALKFAPKDSPELQIERGFRIAGDLMLPTGANGAMQKFAGVDVGVGDLSLWAKGELGAFTLGPIQWEDALIDLVLSPQEQHFFLKGEVSLFGGVRSMLDVGITRDALSFHSEFEIYDLFSATLSAEAAFNLRNPAFRVDAVVENNFGEYLWPFINAGVTQLAEAGGAAIDGVQTGLAAAEVVLANQDATIEELRTLLETQRANALAALQTAIARQTAAGTAMNSAYAAYLRAHRSWSGTPVRQARLRAQRQTARLRALATYRARRATYNVRSAGVGLRRGIYNAIPPVDRNVLLLGAVALRAALLERVQTMQANLTAFEERYNAFTEAITSGGEWFTVERAEFHADLQDLVQGRGVDWSIQGNLAGRPYELNTLLNFADAKEAVAQVIRNLLEAL